MELTETYLYLPPLALSAWMVAGHHHSVAVWWVIDCGLFDNS